VFLVEETKKMQDRVSESEYSHISKCYYLQLDVHELAGDLPWQVVERRALHQNCDEKK
jgi:hypothetical protein